MAYLVVQREGHTLQYDLNRTIIMGRGSQCDLLIPSAKASRQHAQVTVQNGIYTLQDLGSSNGTFVGDKQITSHMLVHGDLIRIGNVAITYLERTSDPLVGRRLGHYHILQQIGQGGMGTIYRANQVGLNREVALKVMKSELAETPGFIDDFFREARISGNLEHPNMIHVFDAGKDSGYYFLSMEYVRGETLSDRLDRLGRIPPEEVIQFCAQVADGLAYAHGRQITHQDIKPQNVMVTVDDKVKIADLGLAKVMQYGEDSSPDRPAMGTPLYIPPEVIRKSPPDFRSDLYSLSATMYHLLTGEPPFTAERVRDIVRKHLEEPAPDPRKLVPEIPAPLAELVILGMSKDPARRPSTAEEFGQRLRAIPAGGEAAAKSSTQGMESQRSKPSSSQRGRKSNKAGPARSASSAIATHGKGIAPWKLCAAGSGVGLLLCGWLWTRLSAKPAVPDTAPAPAVNAPAPADPSPATVWDDPAPKPDTPVPADTTEAADQALADWKVIRREIEAMVRAEDYASALRRVEDARRRFSAPQITPLIVSAEGWIKAERVSCAQKLLEQARSAARSPEARPPLMRAWMQYADTPAGSLARSQLLTQARSGRQGLFQTLDRVRRDISAFRCEPAGLALSQWRVEMQGTPWLEVCGDLAELIRAAEALRAELSALLDKGVPYEIDGKGAGTLARLAGGRLEWTSSADESVKQAVEWEELRAAGILAWLDPEKLTRQQRLGLAFYAILRADLETADTLVRDVPADDRLREQIDALKKERLVVGRLERADQWLSLPLGIWRVDEGRLRASDSEASAMGLLDAYEGDNMSIRFTREEGAVRVRLGQGVKTSLLITSGRVVVEQDGVAGDSAEFAEDSSAIAVEVMEQHVEVSVNGETVIGVELPSKLELVAPVLESAEAPTVVRSVRVLVGP